MKKLMLISLLLSFSAFADLYKLVPGTYNGKSDARKSQTANLFLVDYPGRAGSFLGVILRKDKVAFAYLVDKFAPNTYGMVPLRVLKNGVIGLSNSNPSLILKLSLKGRKRYIQVLDAGTLNNFGFGQSFSFEYDNNSHKQRLANVIPGSYRGSDRKKTIAVGGQDYNNEAYFTAATSILSGDFVLREVRPGLHLPLKSVLKNTGIEVSGNASGMVIFVNKQCVLGVGTHMLHIDHGGKVTSFKKL